MNRRPWVFTLLIVVPLAARSEEAAYPDHREIPQVQAFLGDGDLGVPHEAAPPELAQFGRLVGIWEARLKMRGQNGAWVEGAPALWIWKYALDGFATQDLWIHTADHLPAYLQALCSRRPRWARSNGDMVMNSKSEFGLQRVTFSDISETGFTWSSEYSRDGEQWMEVMRVEAKRRM